MSSRTMKGRTVRGCVHAACTVLAEWGWDHTPTLEDEVEKTYVANIGRLHDGRGGIDYSELAHRHEERAQGQQGSLL